MRSIALPTPTYLPAFFRNGLFVAVFAFLALELRATPQIDFSKLKEGESIRLTFESAGCFHRSRETITFSKGKVVSATLLKADPKTSTSKLVKYIEVETIPLKKGDVGKLNKLLRFYRSPRKSRCTTIDKISIDLIKNGQTVLQEKYTDASCDTYDRKDLLTISRLRSRFKTEQEATSAPEQ